MSKIIPNKEHSQTALIFCLHLKKTAAESHRLLQEAYNEHVPMQNTYERWFQLSIVVISRLQKTKNMENRQENLKMWNYKH